VFHVTAITHRKDPVYSATVVGRPPMEDCYLAYATERLFLPLIRTILPEIKDYRLPWEGVFHNIVTAAIDKEFPGHAAKVMNGLWGTGQMSFAKAIVLVDDEGLLTDGGRLLRHILDIIDLNADITITEGILDVLDHSAPQGLYGSKIGIDATSRIPGERPRQDMTTPSERLGDDGLLSRLKALDTGFTALRTVCPDSRRPLILTAAAKDAQKNSAHYMNLVKSIGYQGIWVLYDSIIDLRDDSLVLWKAFNNVDPGRDIRFIPSGAVIDATRKTPSDGHSRPWPDDIVMSPEIVRQVDEKFPEFIR